MRGVPGERFIHPGLTGSGGHGRSVHLQTHPEPRMGRSLCVRGRTKCPCTRSALTLTRCAPVTLAGVSKSYTLEAGAGGQQVLQTDGINLRGVWPAQVGGGPRSRFRELRAWGCQHARPVPCPSAGAQPLPCSWEGTMPCARHARHAPCPMTLSSPHTPQDLIDCNRLSCNNPAAMLAAYGVEACRATIVKEVRCAVCCAAPRCASSLSLYRPCGVGEHACMLSRRHAFKHAPHRDSALTLRRP